VLVELLFATTLIAPPSIPEGPQPIVLPPYSSASGRGDP
jgi:hypothetical protein